MPPLPAPSSADPDSNKLTLVKSKMYGGLHFAQKDVGAAAVAVGPGTTPQTWSLKMTRPGGGNLAKDPVTKGMEVEGAVLVLGYEWD
jgi:hypothetical protein